MSPADPLPDPLPPEPLAIAAAWLADAWQRRDQPNPNAMVLATSTPDGRPSARVVLSKGIDVEAGTVRFVTNYDSRKGREIEANPRAALTMHWDHTHRQVRLEGVVTRASAADSDAYFATRAWASRLGAHASEQSRPVASRAELEAQLDEQVRRFGSRARHGARHPASGALGRLRVLDRERGAVGRGRRAHPRSRAVYARASRPRRWHVRGRPLVGDAAATVATRDDVADAAPRLPAHGAGVRRVHGLRRAGTLGELAKPLWVGVFPIAGDTSERTSGYVAGLSTQDFQPIADFMRREAVSRGRPPEVLRLQLHPGPFAPPPERSASHGAVANALWSLRLRWYAWRRMKQVAGPPPTVRLFVIYHDPTRTVKVPHSVGLQKAWSASCTCSRAGTSRGAIRS